MIFETALPSKIKYIENPDYVGGKIKNKRMEQGLTQEQTARHLGVERNCIIDWENKHTDPPVEYYPAIIRFLGYFPFPVNVNTTEGKVKYYRFINGLSQENMAKIYGIASATICRLENGVGRLSNKNKLILRTVLESVITI